MIDIKKISRHLHHLKSKINIDAKVNQLSDLKKTSQSPDFWQNHHQAQTTLQQISSLEKQIQLIHSLETEIKTLKDFEIALKSEPDSSLQSDLEKSVKNLNSRFKELEFATYLSGPHDNLPAILSIHAGQGGTEAQDWTAMLFRMYQRYFDQKKWKYQVLDTSSAEEAGLKSVHIKVTGDFAYGYLKKEAGTHRLVRLSPFNADQLRQTSFAKVEVLPVIDKSVDTIEINPEDVQFSAYRAGGHGGQNVNKVSTAVRLVHTPTGLTASCQSERSQDQNRAIAMDILRSQLWAIEEEKKQLQNQQLKGRNLTPSWGHQIRSYVLHPYKMVKDLRTNHESNDPDSVLDGNIDEFIQAELKL